MPYQSKVKYQRAYPNEPMVKFHIQIEKPYADFIADRAAAENKTFNSVFNEIIAHAMMTDF